MQEALHFLGLEQKRNPIGGPGAANCGSSGSDEPLLAPGELATSTLEGASRAHGPLLKFSNPSVVRRPRQQLNDNHSNRILAIVPHSLPLR
ncbi:hypothetical protein PoMZ_13597 [Pyricularia oryzae]|uniref:Uncharacterized protein n=1 Tax=Pyricularia oryzae TaxID=318829 RepID=A0A4P7NVG4_PYROR|nr:hypothetical protein PoMZ_13597 [Pyricularia oryzae]